MAKIYNAVGSFSFPVGKSGGTVNSGYRPLSLDAVASNFSGTMQAEYIPGKTAAPNTKSTLVAGVMVNEYWLLDNTAGNIHGRVTLNYIPPPLMSDNWQSDFGPTFADPAPNMNVAVIKRDAANNWDFTAVTGQFNTGSNPPEARINTDAGTVISKTVTDFSPFTLGYNLNTVLTLPINLLSFTGELQGGTAQLRWQIADDKTLAGFELEYSTNAQNFKRLEKLAPAGLSYAAQHANLPGGTHFYRLKMTNKTGKVQYSRTVLLVKGAAQTTIVGLVQNPVVGNRALVELYSAKAQRVQAQVLDLAGRQVYQSVVQAVAGQQNLAIPLQLLLPGQYYLSVTTADGAQKTMRFGR
jgi:hypothetical protein